jgi:hypothetical protein
MQKRLTFLSFAEGRELQSSSRFAPREEMGAAYAQIAKNLRIFNTFKQLKFFSILKIDKNQNGSIKYALVCKLFANNKSQN